MEPAQAHARVGDRAWHGRLAQQLAHLGSGSHVCLIYSTPDEPTTSIVPFFSAGRDRGERCLLIADAATTARTLSALDASGIDTTTELSRGGLVVTTARETYLRRGRFEPQAMLEFLCSCVEQARADGWAGLRGVGEMSWALGPNVGCRHLIEYEALVNNLPVEVGFKAICLYDRHRFRAQVIRDILRTHPLAIVGDHIHDNPYFEPADLVHGGASEDRRVEWMLEQLSRRTHRTAALVDLSSCALAGASVAQLAQGVAHIISHELAAPCVEIYELGPAGGLAHRLASTGLEVSAVMNPTSTAVWRFENGAPSTEPLIVADWSTEVRIAPRPDLIAHTINSSLGVPIQTDTVEGVVWVHSREPRVFSEDQLVFVEAIAILLGHATARKRSGDEFRNLIENAADVIARFDRDLRIVYVNLAVEHFMGAPAASFVGKTSREAGLPESLACSWDLLLQRAYSTGREQATEFAVPTLEGERHFQTRIVPEFAPDGSVHSVLSISRDVTEQRVAEAERAEVYREMVQQQRRLTELISRMDPQREGDRLPNGTDGHIDHLTRRQRAVLRLVIKGWTNREIAAELKLSTGTVKNHVEQILTKLDVTDRTQAAVRAVELGIVPR